MKQQLAVPAVCDVVLDVADVFIVTQVLAHRHLHQETPDAAAAHLDSTALVDSNARQTWKKRVVRRIAPASSSAQCHTHSTMKI